MRHGLLVSSLFEPAAHAPLAPPTSLRAHLRKPAANVHEAARSEMRSRQPIARPPNEPPVPRRFAQQAYEAAQMLRNPVRTPAGIGAQPKNAHESLETVYELRNPVRSPSGSFAQKKDTPKSHETVYGLRSPVRSPMESFAQSKVAPKLHETVYGLRNPVRSPTGSVVQPAAARKFHEAALLLHAQPDDDVIYRRHNLNVAAGNAQLIAAERSEIQKAAAVTLLLLRPRATAQAGPGGSAIATPIAHAFVREGDDVDVVFDPSAVAVAGPGGFAQAYSDLIINVLGQ